MLPSRGVVKSVSTASRTQLFNQLGAPRGFATARVGHTQRNATTIRLPIGPASLTLPLRNVAIAGSVAFGQLPSGNRSFSLWGWGSGSKDPTSTPVTAQPETQTPAAAAVTEPAATAPAAVEQSTVAAASASSPESLPGSDATAELSKIIPSELDNYESISSIPEQIGYLHTLGIDFGFGTTSMIQWLLEHVHVYSGFPWWGSILATSLLIRLCLLKPIAMGQEHSTRLNMLRKNEPGYNRAMEAWKESMINKDVIGGQAAKAAMKALEEKHKVNKLMPFISFLQLPIGFGMFRILRAMSDLPVPALETGGLAWFTNLTVPDPWYILPLIGPLTMVATMRITSKHSDATQQTTMKAISYVMIPLGFIVTSFMPAGLQWYFVTASVPSLVQTWLMVQPWFRRWIGMMPLPEPLASAPISSISTTGTSTQSPPGMIESMKKSLRDATEAATAKREGTKQRKSKETSEAEEAKLQAEYYESLRERMAELEKQMKRRP